MLRYLDDPSGLRAGLAVLFLAPFYAIVLVELVFAPLKHALVSREPGSQTTAQTTAPRTAATTARAASPADIGTVPQPTGAEMPEREAVHSTPGRSG